MTAEAVQCQAELSKLYSAVTGCFAFPINRAAILSPGDEYSCTTRCDISICIGDVNIVWRTA